MADLNIEFLIKELEKIFQEGQKKGILPAENKLNRAEKKEAIKQVADVLLTYKLNTTDKLNDATFRNMLTVTLMAQLVMKRNPSYQFRWMNLLLTPREQFEKDPKKQLELKNAIKLLLQELLKRKLIQLEKGKTLEGVADEIMKKCLLHLKAQGQSLQNSPFMKLMLDGLTLALVELYNSDPRVAASMSFPVMNYRGNPYAITDQNIALKGDQISMLSSQPMEAEHVETEEEENKHKSPSPFGSWPPKPHLPGNGDS